MLTPLLLAAKEGRLKACEILLKHKADPAAVDKVKTNLKKQNSKMI